MSDIDRYLQAATRDNTRLSYRAAVEHFESQWGGFLPATADSVARYLVDYANTLSVNTLRQRLAGLAAWHLALYWGFLPEAPQPCSATGPSCSGEAQKIAGVPIALMSFIAFGLIAALSFVSLRNKTT